MPPVQGAASPVPLRRALGSPTGRGTEADTAEDTLGGSDPTDCGGEEEGGVVSTSGQTET